MRSRSDWWSWPLRWIVLAAAYYGTGRLGLLKRLTIDGVVVTPMWPTMGVALAALLLWGVRMWPGVLMGALSIYLTGSPFKPEGIAISVGSTCAVLLSWWLLRRVGFRPQMDRLRDGLSLVFLGGFAGMVISASVGASLQAYKGGIQPGGFWAVWSVWWAGDVLGVLLLTPLLLMLVRGRGLVPEERSLGRMVEATLLGAVVLVATPLITLTGTRLLFVMFPMVIWSALRFRMPGAAPTVLYTAILVTEAATDSRGLFSVQSVTERMWFVQAFNGSAVVTSLLLSTLVTEQLKVRLRIEQVCFELAEVVDYLTPGASVAHWPLRDEATRRGSTEL
ncbi:MASE1 domain-containing protein [Streptomyces sp. NPDC050560]|uniref:MASE1 domain-containing protein n=1 Tax=Streptomyces sp. NPDC050560 TaxID=3365630 RepID=UPI0037999492